MYRVDIVLASYNGAKYISQQIDSIIAQTYTNWRLLISDDGSSDCTLDIINTYCHLDKRIFLVNKVPQGGVVKNFSKALEFCDSKYIMFSDQDDYWLPKKIEKSKKIIDDNEKIYGNIPILVFSDLIVVDKNLKVINNSFFAASRFNPLFNTDSKYLLWRSTIYGCSVMFNKQLYDIATPMPFELVNMHDQWFGLIASITGRVIYSYKSYIYYRQHESNLVGFKPKNLSKKIHSSFESIKKIKDVALVADKLNNIQYYDSKNAIIKKFNFITINLIPYFRTDKLYSLAFIIIFFLVKTKRTDVLSQYLIFINED